MRRKPQRRTTRQLRAVYQAVCQSRSHPNADDVYQHARRMLPRISLGTVYHNLQRLVEEGKVCTIFFDDRTARYDPTTADHAHFVCQQCKRIEDLFFNHQSPEVALKDLTCNGYTIFSYNLILYGLCPACEQERLVGSPIVP